MANLLPTWFAQTVFVWPMARANKFAQMVSEKAGSPIETLVGASLLLGAFETGFPLALGKNEGGYSLEQQVNIGRYRVDFLITGRGKQLVIECDGRDFHHATRQQIERDRSRDAELEKLGYTVFRFPGTQIRNDIWRVVPDVLKWVDSVEAFRWYREYMEFIDE